MPGKPPNTQGEIRSKTGRMRLRRLWLIGPMRLQVEEERRLWRPVSTGWTPANWQVVTCWRWARPAETGEYRRAELHRAFAVFAETIPMPRCRPSEKAMKMKKVRLLSAEGADMGSVEIEDVIVGPRTIRRGDQIFVRFTHDIYQLATCHVVPEGA